METTPGLFEIFLFPRRRARVATQMTLRKGGQRKGLVGGWVGGRTGAGGEGGGEPGSFSYRGRLLGEWG